MVAEMYNMVDSMFLGQAIGANAIAAFNNNISNSKVILSHIYAYSYGLLCTSVARSCGNVENLKTIIPNAIVLMFIIISVINIHIFIFKDIIIISLGAL